MTDTFVISKVGTPEVKRDGQVLVPITIGQTDHVFVQAKMGVTIRVGHSFVPDRKGHGSKILDQDGKIVTKGRLIPNPDIGPK